MNYVWFITMFCMFIWLSFNTYEIIIWKTPKNVLWINIPIVLGCIYGMYYTFKIIML